MATTAVRAGAHRAPGMHGAQADTHSDANLPDGPADRDVRAEPDNPAADSNPRPAHVDAHTITLANT